MANLTDTCLRGFFTVLRLLKWTTFLLLAINILYLTDEIGDVSEDMDHTDLNQTITADQRATPDNSFNIFFSTLYDRAIATAYDSSKTPPWPISLASGEVLFMFDPRIGFTPFNVLPSIGLGTASRGNASTITPSAIRLLNLQDNDDDRSAVTRLNISTHYRGGSFPIDCDATYLVHDSYMESLKEYISMVNNKPTLATAGAADHCSQRTDVVDANPDLCVGQADYRAALDPSVSTKDTNPANTPILFNRNCPQVQLPINVNDPDDYDGDFQHILSNQVGTLCKLGQSANKNCSDLNNETLADDFCENMAGSSTGSDTEVAQYNAMINFLASVAARAVVSSKYNQKVDFGPTNQTNLAIFTTALRNDECMPLTCADYQDIKSLAGTAYNNTPSDDSTDESDGSLNANGCTPQNVTNICKATIKYLRGQKIDVANSFTGEAATNGSALFLDADVVKGLKDGTSNLLAGNKTVSHLFSTPKATTSLSEECSTAQSRMNTAFGLAIAGAVFLGLGFLVIGAVIFREGSMAGWNPSDAIEHYHQNVKSNSQDSSTRVMHFGHKGLNLIGYVLLILSGAYYQASSSTAIDNYMSEVIYGDWSTEAAKINHYDSSYLLPLQSYNQDHSEYYPYDGISDSHGPILKSPTFYPLFWVSVVLFALDLLITIFWIVLERNTGAGLNSSDTGSMMAKLTSSIL